MKTKNSTFSWYGKLKKPSFAPPAAIFGPVWSFLYAFIIISFGYVLFQILAGKLPQSVFVPFGLNLVFNLLFTPILFGLKDLELATVDIILVWLTLIWIVGSIFPLLPVIAILQFPYLIWVSFALILQVIIWRMNR